MGITDEPKQSILKLYCPKCRDIYHCNPNQRRKPAALHLNPSLPE